MSTDDATASMQEIGIKSTPYRHQLAYYHLSRDRKVFANFSQMGCLGGDSEIMINWFGSTRCVRLKDLAPQNNRIRKIAPSGRIVRTRSFDSDSGYFSLNEILGAFYSGVKDCVELTLVSGKSLILTPDHEVLTTAGWVMAEMLRDEHEILTNVSKQEWDLRKQSLPKEPILPCSACGNPNSTKTRKSKYFGLCRSCVMRTINEHSDGWTIDKDGYVRVGGHKDHPRASRSGQVLEHILVMEKILGRPLLSNEQIHHKDLDPKNNTPENLVIMTRAEHHHKHNCFRNLRQDIFTPVKDKLLSIKSVGKQDTFDMAMLAPQNNFIANGIVVHNCGKALMELMTAAYLYKAGKIKRLLIVAPKGCYRIWIDDEVPKHLDEALPYKIACWSSYSTKENKAQLEQLEKPGEALRILVVNIEACNTERAVDFMVDFMRKQPTILVIDESTTIKNPRAKRTRIMINVGKYAEYRRICSGNPVTNGAVDLYSQTEFLQRNLLGFSNFFAFRNRFAVMIDQKFGNQSFKKIVGYRDLDALKSMMQKFSFVAKKEDCLDLPQKVYKLVDIQMGPRQTAAYNSMLQDAYIQLANSAQVTAQMAITQIMRLHQIACGFLKPDNFDEVPFGEPNDRIETMLALLDQAPGKVIIWSTYRYNIKQIVEAISEKYGEKTVVDFYGATSDDDRKYAKQSFQDVSSTVKYFVSNPATGKFGNTLTRATTVLYFSNDYNLESREQSEDRAHRIGQLGDAHTPGEDPSVLYIDLQVRGTVDERIIKVLKGKKKLSDEVVASNWAWLVGSAVK